jgi:hypothetical protein
LINHLLQEYLGGRTELEGYKRGLDSFVCAVMPNSGNTQIHTTPGMCLIIIMNQLQMIWACR